LRRSSILVACCVVVQGCGSDARPIALRSGAVGPSAVAKGDLAVAVFSRPLRDGDRHALLEAGVTPVAPLRGGWLVRGDVPHARDVPGVAWMGRVPPEARIDPALRLGGDRIVAVATLLPGADSAAIATRLSGALLPVDGVGERRIVSALSAAEVPRWIEVLAADPDVLWLGRRGRRVLLNDESVWVGQSGTVGETPLFAAGITGEGQIAGLIGTGLDVDSCWFSDPSGLPAVNDATGIITSPTRRKVIAVDFLWGEDDPANPAAWDDQGHGTHVAGTLAGDGGTFGVHDGYDGMAPGAKLVVQDGGALVDDCADLPGLGCPVVDLVPLFEQAWAQGARVHSNSWGDQENAAISNVYTDGSEDADIAAWHHPDLLLVFAAGNDGGTDQVFSPSNAKNTISVGATLPGDQADEIAAFSSGGPTSDGRIKPDLVFPGQAIGSAASDADVTTGNCDIRDVSGTSMATPGIAGLALLVRQYFEDGWYPTAAPVATDGFDPTSALVKATLIASAQPMLAEQAFAGWGRPQLDLVLPLDATAPRDLLAVDEGEGFLGEEDAVEFEIEVLDSAESLRVVLVWRDPPSSPMAESHLVNDLDLLVHAPDGAMLFANVLEGFWSQVGGGADRVNNVEVVRVETPEVGTWQISVSPFEIAEGPQPWALVVSGAFGVVEPPMEPLDGGPDVGADVGVDPIDAAPADRASMSDALAVDALPPIDARDARDAVSGSAGCGCSTSGRPSPWFGLALLFALGRRVRSACRCDGCRDPCRHCRCRRRSDRC